MKKIFFSLFFVFHFINTSFSQTDTDFWFAAPEVSSTHADKPVYLRMSTGSVASTVTIAQPANAGAFGGSPIVVTIPPYTTVSQDLTTWIMQLESGYPTPDIIENKGLHITATSNVSIYYEVLGTISDKVKNSDIFVLKGKNALGIKFYTPFQNLLKNSNGESGTSIVGYSAFDIVATENNTTITITPTQKVFGNPEHAANTPYTITLNKGQTYSGRALGQLGADHLSGSLIVSDKPIAVTIKDDSVVQDKAYDLVGDQLIPVEILGTDYIVLKGALNKVGTDFGDRAVICATQDATEIRIGGVLKTTINQGQTYNYQVNGAAEYILTSKPVYVMHLSGFGDELGGAILPAIVCTGSKQVSFFRDTEEPFFINLLVKTGSEGNFTIKNSTTGVTTTIPATAFTTVPGTPVAGEWKQAHIPYNTSVIPAGSNNLIGHNSDYFHLGIVNGDAVGAGCRYGYFSDFGGITGGEAIASSAHVCLNNPTSILLKESVGDIKWQQSANGIDGWIDVTGGSGQGTSSYTTPNLASNTFYRAVLSSGTCIPENSTVAPVIIDTPSLGGSISGSKSVCYGNNTGVLTLSEHIGDVLKWESSTDNFATVTSIANTGTTQSYTNLTATTTYRAVIKSGACSPVNSAITTVTVDSASAGGSINVIGNSTVCSGSNSGSFTVTGYVGSIERWESSSDDFVTVTSIANTSATQAYTNLIATTKYRAVIKSGTCSSAISSPATITVDSVSIGGSIRVTGNDTVCSGSNSGLLTVTGYKGSIERWESSTDDFTTVAIIPNTGVTQTYTNLTATTKYRAVIKSGTCSSANSAIFTIAVDPVSVGGTISVTGNSTVCSGSNSGLMTVAGFTGNVERWESSTDNFATITSIANTGATQAYTNLIATTKYRAVIKSGTCSSAISSHATITVDSVSTGGSIRVTGNDTVCSGGNSGLLTVTGYKGSIERWESSTDDFTTVAIIPNTGVTQPYTNLTATTKYRAVIKSGTCSSANSAIFTITVDPVSVGGTISVTGNSTVCSGSNSGFITVAGFTGTVIGWESSSDNFATITSIANTGTTQAYSNLTTTTKYRAVIKSGTCSSANSVIATITVDSVSSGGDVNTIGTGTACSGNNSGSVRVTGFTGTITAWESSIDNFSTLTTITNTGNTHTYNNLSATTKFRAVIKSGTCSSANSSAAIVTVDPVSAGGKVSKDTTVCSGGNSGTLKLAGYTGTIIRWESSTDDFVLDVNSIANTSDSLEYLNITKTTKYRAVIQSGVCVSANSFPATITVDPGTAVGAVSKDDTLCSGSNSGLLTLIGHIGNVVRWESSTDNFSTIHPILNTSSSQSFSGLTTTTKYRAVVKSGTCPLANSLPATITVNPVSNKGVLSNDSTVCSRDNFGTVRLTNYTGDILRWESSTDDFQTTIDTLLNTSPAQSYTNLITATQYRAIVQSGVCSFVHSPIANIHVSPVSIGGIAVAVSDTICNGSSSQINLTGNRGAIQWEESPDTLIWTVLPGETNTGYNTPVLTATTYYRAKIKSGVCDSTYSNIVSVKVDAKTNAGSIEADASALCGENKSTTIRASGYTGSLQWQRYSDKNSWQNTGIGDTLPKYITPGLTETTYFRVVVKSGVCDTVHSAVAPVVINTASVGGEAITGSSYICNNTSDEVKLINHTGDILKWETSTDTVNWNAITVNSDSFQTPDLVVTTYYRATVKTVSCPAAQSSIAAVQVKELPDYKLGADSMICQGTSIALNAKPGFTDYEWQNGVKGPVLTIYHPGEYSVKAITPDGCPALATITISDCKKRFIPNVFTPNQDGTNELFIIQGLVPNSKLEIYNRWGVVVFSSDNYSNEWDGGGCTEGLYFYIYREKNGATYPGSLEIIR